MIELAIDRIAFSIGSKEIAWYGVLVASGFLLGMIVLNIQAKKRNVDAATIADLTVACVIGSIAGARLLFVLVNYRYYAENPAEIIRIDQGGLVFYGGFFGAFLSTGWLMRRRKLPFWRISDIFALAIPIGQAVGRMGCLVNGCCFGHPTESRPAIQYTNQAVEGIIDAQIRRGELKPDGFDTQCLPVVPSQIYQGLVNVGIFFALIVAARYIKRPGRLFALFMILYAASRFVNEFNRGDYLTYHFGLTPAQVICLFVLPAGIALFWYLGRSQANEDVPATDSKQ